MRASLVRAAATRALARPRAPNPSCYHTRPAVANSAKMASANSAGLGRALHNYAQRIRDLEEEDLGQTDAVSYAVGEQLGRPEQREHAVRTARHAAARRR